MGKNKNGKNGGGNEGENKPNEEKKSSPNDAVVLGVYLHCEGCVDLVVNSLRGFDGVEVIEPDIAKHRVIVKGKGVDPVKVTERLKKKTGKHVDLISPIPQKKQEKKEEKKPQPPKVVEVLLKVFLHCEGCAKDVKTNIHKMAGVQTVEPDMATSQVKVKGTFEPKALVEFVNKRLGKNAEIVKSAPVKNNEKEKDEKKEGNNSSGKDLTPYPKYPLDLVYAPQLFSDENPNACSIM